MREELDAISQRQRWCLGGLLIIWLLSLFAALNQAPRADLSQRNYELNPLRSNFWRNSMPAADFWAYPLESNPAERLTTIRGNLNSVHFVDAQHGWVVGVGGTIFTTADGGARWQAQASGSSAWLFSAHFVDAQHGWAVGDGGILLVTANGGARWQAQASGTSAALNSVHFVDAQHGWVVGVDGTILATADGGAHWQAQASGTSAWLNSVHFVDTQHGWAIGVGGTILATADGGAHWQAQASGTSAWLNSVHFVDTQHGWAVGVDGTILATANGGAHWQAQPSGTSAALRSVHFVDEQHGWVAGDSGTILATADGGARWQAQSSGTRATLRSVHFVDEQHGWAAGDSGTILATANGGSRWQAQFSGNNTRLNSMHFVDAQHGWAVGVGGTILTTADGGARWQTQPSGSSAWLYSVHFVDDQHGWAVGVEGTILATTDGGARWQAQGNGIRATLNSVHFVDDQHGWVVGNGGAILATTDGGAHWQTQLSGSNAWLYSVHFVDDQHGWTVGSGGAILATADGGARWQAQTSGTSAALNSVHFVDDQHGWAVGDGGTILATADGGARWHTQASGTSAALNSLHFADAQHGRAVGDGGILLVTTDGGAHWQAQASGPSAVFNSVHFVDAQHGWAVGFGGTLLATADGGAHWQAQANGTSAWLNSIHFVDGQHGWAVGFGGTILTTADGGARWRAQASGTSAWLNSVLFVDDQHGWAIGAVDTILATADGGAHWHTQASGTSATLTSVHFVDDQHGWAVGDGGTILTTVDGGARWQAQASGTSAWLNRVLFVDKQHGWAVGVEGTILTTADGGARWHTQASGTSAALNSVHFVDAQHGWAVGVDGTILTTADGGARWQAQASGTSATLTSVHFVDDQHGWAVGNGGTILATADGGLSWKRVRLLKHTLSPAPWFWLLSLAIVILALAIAGKPPERDALQQIGSSDKPRAGLADDRLQTAPRVLALSRLLRNRGTSPPLVIAIDGEWGTGKSTLMRMLETDLRCYGARCAWFNAWHHQNDEHLLAALLDTLRREITPRTPVYWLKLFALRLRRYRWRAMPSLLALALLAGFWAQLLSADRSASASRLEGLADAAACLTVGTACATVAAPESTSTTHLNLRRRVAQISRTHERSVLYLALLLSALPALWGLLGTLSPFPNPAVLKAAAGMMKMRAAEKETSYRYRFAGDFRDVTTALLPYRLYLFIDDLDRCDSKSTASLLEAVNFLCESGEVVVVLGIARETVECNLGLAYSELAAEMARDGETPQKRRDFAERFLRKLVNLRVQVPELDSRGTAAMLTEQRPARTEYEWRLVPGYLRWLDRMLLPALGLFFVLIFMACAGTLGFYLGQGERTPQTRSPDFAVQTPTSSGAAANSAAPATARPEATQKNDQPPPGTSYLEPGDPGHVPAAVWMLLGALGLVLGLRLIWTWRTRFNSSDPRDLHWSLEAWSPLLRLTQTSPREIRRFQNRLRHLVATLNAPEQIPALPESPGPFVEAWYRRVLNEQEAAQLRGEVDGMPGSLITAMLAMFAAAQTHAVWPAVLAASLQWLTGEPKLAEIADEPLSEQKRREFHYAAVRLDLERLQWNEPIPTKPEDRSQVLQRYADALFDAVQEHQQKAGESNLERFSLNRLTGAGPGFGGNPWEKLLKQYELLYGKPRLRKA